MAPSMRAIVIDNASGDDTLSVLRTHPEVTVLANSANRGFAAAANQGVRVSPAEFFLLMNPDVTILTPVDKLVEAARQYGLAAGRLVDQQLRNQKGFTIRRFQRQLASNNPTYLAKRQRFYEGMRLAGVPEG